MTGLFSQSPGRLLSVSRPLVAGLFVASCLLAVVSWYTTQQGMALYLSTWFSVLASLGVQTALVLVAWLVGFTRTKRALLISVYAITAVVSIAFSYASLHTWFSARERPAVIERRLYDNLSNLTGRSQELLASAVAEGERHALALEEMTEAEKTHGYISRAQDADPYLAGVREAVAREAATYDPAYREGAGTGLRYTAFERYAKLARQSVARMMDAQRALAEYQGGAKPLDSTENQLRQFRQAYDSIPWEVVKESLHEPKIELPAVPAYTDFVDRSATGQEDLLIAFNELVSTPGSRQIFAFSLAAFIDIVIFLLAYASGPYFFGAPGTRWISAGATLDSSDHQVFLRNLLRKVGTSSRGLPRVEGSQLSPGELQLCLLLCSKGQALCVEEEGHVFYLLDESIHEHMMDSLSQPGFTLRASSSGVVS